MELENHIVDPAIVPIYNKLQDVIFEFLQGRVNDACPILLDHFFGGILLGVRSGLSSFSVSEIKRSVQQGLSRHVTKSLPIIIENHFRDYRLYPNFDLNFNDFPWCYETLGWDMHSIIYSFCDRESGSFAVVYHYELEDFDYNDHPEEESLDEYLLNYYSIVAKEKTQKRITRSNLSKARRRTFCDNLRKNVKKL